MWVDSVNMYSVSQKTSAPKTFCNIFTQAKEFPRNFANFLPININTSLPVLVDLSKYLAKSR